MKKHLFISIFLALALCVGSLSSALAQTDVTEGGTATSNGGIRTGEEPAKAFDNTTSTKWCVIDVNLPVNLRYDFSGTTAYAVNSYTVASANDSPERDPKNWQFQGSNDGTNWTTLDTRSNIAFTSRFQTQTFTFSNSTSYQMYQLNITAYYSGTDGKVQLSELQMFACSAPSAPTGLTATAGNTQVALSWTASSGATSYNVYRGASAGGESTTAIATGVTTTSYTNTGLTNGTTYYYKVAAVNSCGTSSLSGEASATPSGGSSGDLTEGGSAFDDGAGNPTGEGEAQAFDNSTSTKCLVYASTGNIGYDFSGTTAYAVNSYTVASADDEPGRDPKNWNLQGSNNGSTWTTVDTRSNISFASRKQTQTFSFTNSTAYQMYRLNVTANSAGSGYLQIAEIQMFASGGCSTPSAPTGLTATAGDTQIALSWTASSGATSYSVYRGTTAGGESTTAIATGITATSYTNTGLTNGTAYYYKVTAVNSCGTSGYSNEASATPASGVPSAPTGLTATAGDTQIALSWTASSGATSYSVYRGITAGGESTTAIASGITTTSYTNTGLTNGTTYYYKVKATNAGGTSGYSNEASATPTAGSAPSAPTGLTASASNALVLLSWNVSAGATSYSVYRGTTAGGESTTAIASGITTTGYANTGLTNGTTYYYKVKATNASGTSGYSNEASATPVAQQTGELTEGGTATSSGTSSAGEGPDQAFDNNTATKWCSKIGQYGSMPINLVYDFSGSNSYAVNSYTVASANDYPQRDPKDWQFQGSNDGSTWTTVDTRTNVQFSGRFETQTFNFINLASYQMYRLNITANRGDVSTQLSECQMYANTPTPPPAPTGLTATTGYTKVSLSWTASDLTDSYSVYRGTTAGGESTTAVASGITTTSYVNTGLTNGTTYYYKVKATNVIGTSGYSNEASATPAIPPIPPAPTGLTATGDNTKVLLNWNASSDAESYNIYRGTTAGGESTTAVASGITTTNYVNTGLTNGTTYYYKVKATNFSGTSGYSTEASATATDHPSVSIIYGTTPPVSNGINTWLGDTPGGESIQTYNGKSGLQTNTATGSWGIYGSVNDAFIYNVETAVKVSIEYWDKVVPAGEAFSFNYSSTATAGWETYVANTVLTGTNTWKTVDFYLDNARFANDGNGGSDFRLFSWSTDICIHSITIEKLGTIHPASITVNPSSATIVQGASKTLVAIIAPFNTANKVVTWSSSNTSVATINNTLGLVTGVSGGSATITATTQDGGLTSTCNVSVSGVPGTGIIAAQSNDFINSIGVCTHIAQGQDPSSIATALQYAGIRSARDDASASHINSFISVHNQTGVKWVLVTSGPNDGSISTTLDMSRQLANVGGLLALEGPNEPNGWNVTYQGATSQTLIDFFPVAKWMKDFYSQAKSDPVLKNYPVFNSSEAGGSEPNNVGLQFNTIPVGTNCLMPDGTQYADYANVHNYLCRMPAPYLCDNLTWMNASPNAESFPADAIYGEYGVTWRKGYAGYNEADRTAMPKVTTETGYPTNGDITETQQAKLFLNCYLAQFKRGFINTMMYMITDEGIGPFGLFYSDFTPKMSGNSVHNLTTILNDNQSFTPGRVNYSISGQPATTHDLLLQKSNGNFELVVWDEMLSGSNNVTVNLGSTYGTVKVYDPHAGTSAIQTLSNVSSVTLSMGFNAYILEFNPTGLKSATTSAAVDKKGANDILHIAYLQDQSVNVAVDLSEAYTLQVISLDGRLIKTIRANEAGVYNLTGQELKKGMYIVNVVGKNNVASKKIVLY